MTKSAWVKSEVQTKLSREVTRVNSSIEDGSFLKENSGLLNPGHTYRFKYSVESHTLYVSHSEEGYELKVYSPNYYVSYAFSRISPVVYRHSDGRMFTRIFLYNEKHKTVGSVDIPEHRRD